MLKPVWYPHKWRTLFVMSLCWLFKCHTTNFSIVFIIHGYRYLIGYCSLSLDLPKDCICFFASFLHHNQFVFLVSNPCITHPFQYLQHAKLFHAAILASFPLSFTCIPNFLIHKWFYCFMSLTITNCSGRFFLLHYRALRSRVLQSCSHEAIHGVYILFIPHLV